MGSQSMNTEKILSKVAYRTAVADNPFMGQR